MHVVQDNNPKHKTFWWIRKTQFIVQCNYSVRSFSQCMCFQMWKCGWCGEFFKGLPNEACLLQLIALCRYKYIFFWWGLRRPFSLEMSEVLWQSAVLRFGSRHAGRSVPWEDTVFFCRVVGFTVFFCLVVVVLVRTEMCDRKWSVSRSLSREERQLSWGV